MPGAAAGRRGNELQHDRVPSHLDHSCRSAVQPGPHRLPARCRALLRCYRSRGGQAVARRRCPVRIAKRFGLLVSVLLLFASAFASVILYQTGSQQRATDRLRDLVLVAGRAGVLCQELQKERTVAAAAIVGVASDQRGTFVQQTEATSAATEPYQRLRRGLSSVPPGAAVLLDRIDIEIGGLPGLREQVRSG